MKTQLLVALGVGLLASTIFYLNRPRTLPVAPLQDVGEPVAAPTAPAPVAVEPTTPVPEPAPAPQLAAPEPTNRPSVASSKAGLEAIMVHQAVESLVSPQVSYEQKQATWKQVADGGKFDAVITELERGMAADPQSAQYPATLGQAYLRKCGTLQDVREQGILAMQADKAFDAALALDPSNWEARFTKAVALSYWPASMNRSEEVIGHFQTLIQQQELQAPQENFSQSYLWLGDQYQKAGRTEEARAVWERGAGLFPNDTSLKGRLAGANVAQHANLLRSQ